MNKLIQHFNDVILNDFGIVATSVEFLQNGNPQFYVTGLTEQARVWLNVRENILVSSLVFNDNGRHITFDVLPTTIMSVENGFIIEQINSVKNQILNKIREKISALEVEAAGIESEFEEPYTTVLETMKSWFPVENFSEDDEFEVSQWLQENLELAIDNEEDLIEYADEIRKDYSTYIDRLTSDLMNEFYDVEPTYTPSDVYEINGKMGFYDSDTEEDYEDAEFQLAAENFMDELR